MRKKHSLLQILLAVVIVAAVTFGVEGICNLSLLRLPEGQRGEIALDLTQAEIGEAPADEFSEEGDFAEEDFANEDYAAEEDAEDEDYAADDASTADPSTPTILAGQPLTLAYEGYVHHLRVEGEVNNSATSTGMAYTVTCTLADGSTQQYTSIFYLSSPADDVIIDAQITSLTLTCDEAGITLSNVVVNNLPRLHVQRMLFSGLTAAAVCLLWLLRELIGRKAEYGFLIVALCFGLFLTLCLPPFTGLSYDDETHFGNVWSLSWGRYVHATDAADSQVSYSWTYQGKDFMKDPADTAIDHARLTALLDQPAMNEVHEETTLNQWQLINTGYLPSALGMLLGRVLGAPMSVQMILSRLFNLLAYVALCFFAIRQLKRFKLTFAVLALMPSPMYMACSLSYDPLCSGLCFLGTALTLEAMLDRSTRLSWQRLLGIYVCFLLACTIKAVYAPMLLLVLMLPRSKFASRKQAIYVKFATLLVLCLAVGAVVASITGDINNLQDSRGDGADSNAQIAFILAHPLTYLGIFFSTIFNNFNMYFLEAARTGFGYLGNQTGTWSLLGLMLLLFTLYTDNDAALDQRVTWQQRVGLLIIGGMTVGLVFTTMYVAFSPVGATSYSGVQGRYLQPVLPILFLLLSPNGVKNSMNKTGWHCFFYLSNLALLMITCGQLVLLAMLR